MPTVSVIVPVYNVEPYLRRCVNSILAQTFQDFEVILVDDGSPDNCGAICDEYAAQDARIHVIHKENGGLSSARNTGIREAQGDYLMFVDSDDWIAPDMARDMLQAILENDCDMAICQYYLVTGDEVRRRTSGDLGIRVLEPKESMRLLIEDRLITNHACRRLYKKELFSDISFPEGKTYEDIFVMSDLTLKCRLVVYLDQAYYYYYQNPAGIVAVKTVTSLEDNLDGILHQYEVVKASFPDLMEAWYASYIKKIIVLLEHILKLSSKTERTNTLLRRVLDELASIPQAARKRYSREERFCCFAAQFPIAAFQLLWSSYHFLRRLYRKLRRIVNA